MFEGLFSWLFPAKKFKPLSRELKSPPPLYSSSSYTYVRNGKTVYEERDGKVIKGTPADKVEAENLAKEVSSSAIEMTENMRKDMNRMFDNMKKMFD